MSFRVSLRSLTRPINAQVTIAREAEVLEQEAALEVLVGVDDGLELSRRHDAVVLGPFDLLLVYVLEDAGGTGCQYAKRKSFTGGTYRLQAMWNF